MLWTASVCAQSPADSDRVSGGQHQFSVELAEDAATGTVVWQAADERWSELTILSGDDAQNLIVSDGGRSIRIAEHAHFDFESQAVHNIRLQIRVEAPADDPFRSSFAASAIEAGARPDDIQRLFRADMTVDLTIRLRDVNESPELSADEFTIAEDAAPLTSVGSVTAMDPDAGDSLHYELAPEQGTVPFSIDPQTGVVSIAPSGHVDFESTSEWPLRVRVTDSAGHSSAATLTIHISDVDEAPVVSSSQPLRWELDPQSWAAFGSVAATDPEHSLLTYSLVEDPTQGGIGVDEDTGALFAADRAKFGQFHGTEQTLLVRVTDGTGLSTDVAARIFVPDNYYVPPGPPLEDSPDYLSQFASQAFPFGLCIFACVAWSLGLRSIRRARRRAERSRLLDEALASPARTRLAESPDDAPLAAGLHAGAIVSDDAGAGEEEPSPEIGRDIEDAFDQLEDTLPEAGATPPAATGDPLDRPNPPRQPTTVLSDDLLARLVNTPDADATHDNAESAVNQTTDRVHEILEAVEEALERQAPLSESTDAQPADPGTAFDSSADEGGTAPPVTETSPATTSSFAADLLSEIQQSTRQPEPAESHRGTDGPQPVSDTPTAAMSQSSLSAQLADAFASDDSAAQTQVVFSESTDMTDDELRNSVQVTRVQEQSVPSAGKVVPETTEDAETAAEATPKAEQSDGALGQYLATLFAARPEKKQQDGEHKDEPKSGNQFKPTSFIESYMNSKAELDDETSSEPIATFHRDTIRARSYQKMDLEELRNRTISFREIAKQAADSAVEASLLQQARVSAQKHRKILAAIGVGSLGILIAGGMQFLSFSTTGELLVVAACLAAGEFWMCRRRLRQVRAGRQHAPHAPVTAEDKAAEPPAEQDRSGS